ncbi:MAG: hypothetical protein HY268_00715 [Deltaproteobacteria bacterium]|nr:hypothetical protein [Deltaproteobacteria bacterium]
MGGEAACGFHQPARIFHLYYYVYKPLILGLLFFPFVFGACSPERQSGEAESLEKRVKGFWDARVADDDAKAYNYEAYSKINKMTLQQYLQARNRTLKYTGYEVKKIEEKGDEATVIVDVNYHLVIPARADLNLSITLTEPWRRLDGQWYRQLPESKLESP